MISWYWLVFLTSPFFALVFGTLYSIDKLEKEIRPPKGNPGLPAWHKENT